MQLKQILTELIAIDTTSDHSNEPLVSRIEQFLRETNITNTKFMSQNAPRGLSDLINDAKLSIII